MVFIIRYSEEQPFGYPPCESCATYEVRSRLKVRNPAILSELKLKLFDGRRLLPWRPTSSPDLMHSRL